MEPFDRDRDYRLHVDGRSRYDGVAAFLASRDISLERGTPADPPDAATCSGLANKKDAYFAEQLAVQGVEVFPDTLQLIDGAAGRGQAAGRRLSQ
jgi:hypothetical protein